MTGRDHLLVSSLPAGATVRVEQLRRWALETGPLAVLQRIRENAQARLA